MRLSTVPMLLILAMLSMLLMAGCETTGASKASTDLTAAATSFSFDLKFTPKNMCSGPFPAVSLSGVPSGTDALEFSMIDIDYGNKDHGQGLVKYAGNNTLSEGTVPGIMGPCMESNNAHKYKITLKALSKDGQVIAVTTRSKTASK